ncbi:hypothetical protein Tco_0282180 [Tanacetum coccineum]
MASRLPWLGNPFIYSSGDFRVISDVNFKGMSYSDFFGIIQRHVLVLHVKMFYKIPGMPLTSLKELATDDDVIAFIRYGYDHGNQIELYIEHSGYDVLEMINDELNEDAKVHKSSYDSNSSDGYQLWYMQNDSSKLLVKCGRDVSKGKCAGMKGEKGVSSEKADKGESSKQADKGETSNKSENGRGSGLTMISDAYKGLIEAVASWFLNAKHNKSNSHRTKTPVPRPPSSPPIMPPKGPQEPRSNAYKGKGLLCPLKRTNISDVSKTVGKKQGKATISKWFDTTKTGGALKKKNRCYDWKSNQDEIYNRNKTFEYQMEMDYEASAAVEVEQVAEEAKQVAIRKICEENKKNGQHSVNHPCEVVPLAAPLNPTVEVQTQQNQVRTRSKRKQPVNHVVPRVYVKQRGRSERIAKMQGKKFKFDEHGTGSTPEKAFSVSKSE